MTIKQNRGGPTDSGTRPKNIADCNLLEIPSIGSKRTTPWGNPVSAINTVRISQAVMLRPMEEILPPYRIWRILALQARVPGHWRLNPCLGLDATHQLGKMSPGAGINYNYYILDEKYHILFWYNTSHCCTHLRHLWWTQTNICRTKIISKSLLTKFHCLNLYPW